MMNVSYHIFYLRQVRRDGRVNPTNIGTGNGGLAVDDPPDLVNEIVTLPTILAVCGGRACGCGRSGRGIRCNEGGQVVAPPNAISADNGGLVVVAEVVVDEVVAPLTLPVVRE